MPRPKGYKAAGRYGNGIETQVVRIPKGKKEYVERMIIDLPELISGYEKKMKDTRNWTEAKRLIADIKILMEG